MRKLDLEESLKRCVRRDIPACTASCPFGLDVRGFMERLQEGGFAAAYKIYSKAVIFPQIVSRICPAPCEGACFRRDAGGPLAISALERACCRFGASKTSSFFVSDKKKRVVIVGGGLAGMGAAVRLSKRGYHVHLLEQQEVLGGRLWELDEQCLPKEILQEEIRLAVSNKYLTVELGRRVESLDGMTADAFLIATGRGGLRIGDEMPGVFFAGSLTDPVLSPVESLQRGMEMSLILDAFLQSAKPPEKQPALSRYRPDVSGWAKVPPELCAEQAVSREEAVREAKRCMLCTCDACMKVCEPLPAHYSDPVTALLDISGTVSKTELTTKKGQKFINSCTLCGACGEVCDYGVDFGQICLEAKRLMQRTNDMPPVYHEFWLDDMLYSNSRDASLVRMPKGRTSVAYAFFPGCQLAGSDPAYVVEAYRLLLRLLGGDVAVMQMCCGMPAYWSGLEKEHAEVCIQIRDAVKKLGNPAVVLACPSCMAAFEDYLPEIKTYTLWELLRPEDFGDLPQAGRTVCVFDPCAARPSKKLRETVRSLLLARGFALEELPDSGEHARCCGCGGNIYSADAELFERTAGASAGLSEREYAVYCINCRDSFASQNKAASHVLDYLLFPQSERQNRPAPGRSMRRENRFLAKQLLLKEFWNMEMEKHAEDCERVRLCYADGVAEKMDRLLILEEHIGKTIAYGLRSGHILCDSRDGSMTCHLRQGCQTYYAKFVENEDGSYKVLNVYKHRMKILELVRDDTEGGK